MIHKDSPRSCTLALALAALLPLVVGATSQAPAVTAAAIERDGQHDFDFEIGTWKTEVRLLTKPLSGSKDWMAMHGTTVVSKVLGGRANLVELEADYPGGHFSGLSLRLYNPQTRQWSLNFSNAKNGTLATPTIGAFKDGRGEFYDQELLDGRAVFVRFFITPIDANTIHFEQSYSADGGQTWEPNWIATDTRLAAELPSDLAVALEEFDRAQFSNDVETLARLFSDDYVLVNSDASVEDKRQALADFVAPGFKVEPYAMEEPVRQVSSDTAVVAGLVRLRWTQDGKQNTRTVRMVYVWMRRDGRWQATYTQVTRVPS